MRYLARGGSSCPLRVTPFLKKELLIELNCSRKLLIEFLDCLCEGKNSVCAQKFDPGKEMLIRWLLNRFISYNQSLLFVPFKGLNLLRFQYRADKTTLTFQLRASHA